MPRLQQAPSQRARRTAALVAGAALAALCATVLLLGSPGTRPAKVIANDLSDRPTACLAADGQTPSESAKVSRTWNAMLSGAKGLKINVQQLILAAKTPAQARPYLAGLLEQHCTLVVTVGIPFSQAIPADQKLAPHTHFLAIDGGTLPTSTTLQVTTSSNTAIVQNQVRSLSVTTGNSPGTNR